MMAASTWISEPLSFVDAEFCRRLAATSDPVAAEKAVLETVVGLTSAVDHQLPELHRLGAEQWRDGMLVRYRCMLRDMYDPELYPRCYRVSSRGDPDRAERTACGLFRDVAPCGPQERVLDAGEMASATVGHRQTLLCCSIPWQTEWVRSCLNVSDGSAVIGTAMSSEAPRATEPSGTKRPLEVDDEDMDAEEASGSHTMKKSVDVAAADKSDAGAKCPVDGSKALDVEPSSLACLVKLYDDKHALLLNQMVEFVGVLSVHPALNGEQMVEDECGESVDGGAGRAELLARHPPASRVPRLHAVTWSLLTHSNPLLPRSIVSTDRQWMSAARDQLLSVLTSALLGDELAAEFLLLHLLSTVYLRRDLMPLGQMSLNLSNVPAGSDEGGFVARLVGLLRRLVEKLCLFTASRERLNATALVPSKDYETNTLKQGLLQMTANTHLVINETALTPGQLDERGLSNVSALNALIRQQRVEYDFGFHRLPFDADLPVLVLSDGPSLLPADRKLALITPAVDRLSAAYQALDQYLTPDLLQLIRKYLTTVRGLEYSVPEEVQQRVQNDFVSWRQAAVGGSDGRPDADQLHRLLVLGRLQTLSRGLSALTEQLWSDAVQLSQRANARPTRPNA